MVQKIYKVFRLMQKEFNFSSTSKHLLRGDGAGKQSWHNLHIVRAVQVLHILAYVQSWLPLLVNQINAHKFNSSH